MTSYRTCLSHPNRNSWRIESTHSRSIQSWCASIVLLVLSACGVSDKGTIGGASDTTEVLMLAGTEKVISGNIETPINLIKSMTWQITEVNGQNAGLTTKNSDCAAGEKKNNSVTASASSQPITSGSNWSCNLTVSSTVNVLQDAVYDLILTAIDSAGASITFKKPLRVQPNQAFSSPGNALNVYIGGSLYGKPGQVMSIGGLANWQVTASDAQKNQPILYKWTLDSSAPAGTTILSPNNPTTQLYLPLQPSSLTVVPLSLTATSGTNVAIASANVVIDPSSKSSPIIIPPVQQCGPNQSAFIRVKDLDPANPNLFFQWTLDTVAGALPIVVGGANTYSAGFITPAVTIPTLMTVRFEASSSPIAPSAQGNYKATALVQVVPGLTSCQPVDSSSGISFPGY